MLGRLDAGNFYRSNIDSRYRPLEWLLGDFSRFQLNESSGKILSPTAKGLVFSKKLCGPLHVKTWRASTCLSACKYHGPAEKAGYISKPGGQIRFRHCPLMAD
jgi:hypothetical protein